MVDLLNLEKGNPFPGKSLARYWKGSAVATDGEMASSGSDGVISEVVPIDPLNPDPLEMIKPHWPLAALNEGGWTYIRREGNVTKSCFTCVKTRGKYTIWPRPGSNGDRKNACNTQSSNRRSADS